MKCRFGALFLACLVLVVFSSFFALADPPSGAFSDQIESARRAMSAKRYHDAISAFKKANKLQGDACYQCWLGIAASNLQMAEYKQALQAADRAIVTAKDDAGRAVAHNLKGNILTSSADGPKDLSAAEEEYRAASQLNPGLAVYHLNYATAMLRQSKDETARKELEACLAAAPSEEQARQARMLLADPRRGRENFAPDFKVKLLSGEFATLQQFSGKVLVMDFWATWCPPCRESVPELKQLTKKYPAEKLILISVSADEDDGAWRDFVSKKHMDWLQYRDSDHQLVDAFGVHAFPTYLVIDGDGIIRQRITGLNPQESVVRRLRATLESMPQLGK